MYSLLRARGSILVSSLTWQALGDRLVSDRCKGDQELAKSFKDVVGTSIIFIDGTIAQAPDEESLARSRGLHEAVPPA